MLWWGQKTQKIVLLLVDVVLPDNIPDFLGLINACLIDYFSYYLHNKYFSLSSWISQSGNLLKPAVNIYNPIKNFVLILLIDSQSSNYWGIALVTVDW